MATILLVSCQEFAENPDLASVDEDWNTKIFSPELDPTGRISFKNLASFSEFIEKNIEKPVEELLLFEGQFVSLRQRNEELAQTNPALLRIEDDDIEEDPIIADDFTASIVNEKREVMIDGKVVRYTEFGTWVYHDYFTERVEQLLTSTTTEEIDAIYASHDFEEDPFYELEPGIFIFGTPENGEDEANMELKTIDTSNAAAAPWSPNPFDFPWCNRTTNRRPPYIHPDNKWRGSIKIVRPWTFESNRRFKAKVWSTNYVTHSTSGFHTRLQRRRTGIWWASNADDISVSVRGNVYFPYLLSDNNLNGFYIPIKLDPWLYNNGVERLRNTNKASVNFGLITAQIGISNNLHSFLDSGMFCDPENDFKKNVNHILSDDPNKFKFKFCKPKWKAAKNVKIKESESCHFVRKGGFTGEMQIKVKFND